MNINEVIPMENQQQGAQGGGIVSGRMEQGQPQQGQPQQQEQGEEQSNVSPEEQQMYEQVVLTGVNILNEKSGEIVNMIKQSKSVPEGIAQAAAMITLTIFEQTQGRIPKEVMMSAAEEILENVAETAVTEGGMEVSQEMYGKATQLFYKQVAQAIGFTEQDALALADGMDPDEVNQNMEEQAQYSMAG